MNNDGNIPVVRNVPDYNSFTAELKNSALLRPIHTQQNLQILIVSEKTAHLASWGYLLLDGLAVPWVYSTG